jgi:TruD family tRNA pseudouridine synthase
VSGDHGPPAPGGRAPRAPRTDPPDVESLAGGGQVPAESLEELEHRFGICRVRPPLGDAVLTSEPRDFVVEEVTLDGGINTLDGFRPGPSGTPSGPDEDDQGDYVEVTLIKRGLTTRDAVAIVARELGVPVTVISFAGLKDAAALTSQSVRLPRTLFGGPISLRRVDLVEPRRATRPLRIGELRGNRFRIRLRVTPPVSQRTADEFAIDVATRGVRNYFDLQRFGRRLNLHEVGAHLITGDAEAACRVFLTGTGPAEPGQLTALREWASAQWPDTDRIEHHYRTKQRQLGQELELLRAVRRHGTDAIWKVPFLSKFCIEAWVSLLFNRQLSGQPDLTGPVALWDGRESARQTSYSEVNVPFVCPNARRLLRPGSRPAIVRPTEVGCRTAAGLVELSLFLPKGAYATTVVRAGFRLHSRSLSGVTMEADRLGALPGLSPKTSSGEPSGSCPAPPPG